MWTYHQRDSLAFIPGWCFLGISMPILCLKIIHLKTQPRPLGVNELNTVMIHSNGVYCQSPDYAGQYWQTVVFIVDSRYLISLNLKVNTKSIDTFERLWKQGNFVHPLDWMINDHDIPGDTSYGCNNFVSIFVRLLNWHTSTWAVAFAVPTASTASSSSYSG